jgi:isoleucyl-tRNA synthetase
VQHVAALVEARGTNVWWEADLQELMPPGTSAATCEDWVRGEDTLDVWFDSGTSWAAALEAKGVAPPADLVLEGSDQHRGWFQSSLQTAAAVGRGAPYKTVVTHGFVLDDKKQKMSKSLGNVMSPGVVIDGGKDKKKQPAFGADVLRLWVASTDYTRDVSVSPALVEVQSNALRNLRNSARFMMGVLDDFDPALHAVPSGALPELERYVLHLAGVFHREAAAGFEAHRPRQALAAANHFASTELSAFYNDVAKDRLYSEPRGSEARRAVQSALWPCLRLLTQASKLPNKVPQ